MKNEKERMKEYLKDYTNANSDLKRVDSVDKITKGLKISLNTILVVVIIAMIIMLFFIGLFIYPKIYLVFTMNKKQFLKEIEKTYGQKIEIVIDDSTYKGNGTFILRTKKEPKIEFHAAKDSYDNYKLDLEDYTFIYYVENKVEPIFNGINIEKKTETFYSYPDLEFTKCEGYLEVNSYEQIEMRSKQLFAIQKWMEKKIKKFSVPVYLKIGEYISNVNYQDMSSEEQAIFEEKRQYDSYLQNQKNAFK